MGVKISPGAVANIVAGAIGVYEGAKNGKPVKKGNGRGATAEYVGSAVGAAAKNHAGVAGTVKAGVRAATENLPIIGKKK